MQIFLRLYKLIKKRESSTDQSKNFLPIDDTFDIIKHAYIATGHGGHYSVTKKFSKRCVHITSDCIVLFKGLCIKYQ